MPYDNRIMTFTRHLTMGSNTEPSPLPQLRLSAPVLSARLDGRGHPQHPGPARRVRCRGQQGGPGPGRRPRPYHGDSASTNCSTAACSGSPARARPRDAAARRTGSRSPRAAGTCWSPTSVLTVSTWPSST